MKTTAHDIRKFIEDYEKQKQQRLHYDFTEEQKQKIMEMYYCMHEALRDTIREYIEKGKAVIEKDRFGRLVCTILPERT